MSTSIRDIVLNTGEREVFKIIQKEQAFIPIQLLADQSYQVVPALEAIGVYTDVDVLNYVQGIKNAVGENNLRTFINIVRPEIDTNIINYDSLKRITATNFHTNVWNKIGHVEEKNVFAFDGYYKVPTKAQLDHIVMMSWYLRMKHSGTEQTDCDKLAKAIIGWLAMQGYGNLSIGILGIILRDINNYAKGHAILTVQTDNGSSVENDDVWLWDSMYKPETFCPLNATTNELEAWKTEHLAKCLFRPGYMGFLDSVSWLGLTPSYTAVSMEIARFIF